MAVIFKTLSASLAANVNEVTFTDSLINSNSVIEVYYNSNDVYTLETWQDGTTIGIVTSDHNFPVGVKVTINNATSFAPYDDSEILSQLSSLSDDIDGLDGRLDGDEDDIDNLETRMGSAEDNIGTLESGKQDVLTAGDNITIEDNVISASGGDLSYSTTERVIGKWIDGTTDVYEITVYWSQVSGQGNTLITLNHEIANIDKVINYDFMFGVGGYAFKTIPLSDPGWFAMMSAVTQTNIQYRLGTYYNNSPLMLKLHYTKTSS